ncbi:MAG: apolipoprotein N-acyltransferase [Myxococcota bacterium]|nr:apolipoprotein N-acyltransferase [Myxococcota bacterium]
MAFLILFILASVVGVGFRLRQPLLIAAATGAGLGLASPPISFWWLHWVLWVPVIVLMRTGSWKTNFRVGYLAGLVGLATCFFWISEAIIHYSNLPKALALLAVLLFAAAYAVPMAIAFASVAPLRRHFPRAWIFLVPAVAVASEFALLAVDQIAGVRLALFPYFQGATQYRVLELVQIASISGIYTLTYLLYLTNCAVAECVFRRVEGQPIPWKIPASAFAIVLLNASWGALRVERVDSEVATWPTARITQLQQDLTMEERMQKAARGARSGGGGLTKLEDVQSEAEEDQSDPLLSCPDALCTWSHLTGKLRGEQVDLVVYPEGSILRDPRRGRTARRLMWESQQADAPILLGAGYRDRRSDGTHSDHNSVFLFGEDGIDQIYNKMVLLPFGEFIPFSGTFPILKEWIQGPGDFSPGEQSTAFTIEARGDRPAFTFYTPVCYEAIIPHFMRRHMSDSDLLVNITNDGWFGDTMAPHQHAMLAVARTIELGIPMYRLGFTGVSMTATPSGAIDNETGAFERVARIVEVPLGQVDTLYRKLGDWFGWLCTLLSLGLWLILRRKSVTPADAQA